MRHSDEAFGRILAELALPSAGHELVKKIRLSQPVRRVNGSNSVSGRFPSRKMGLTIQYESRNESAAISLYEADPSVEEFYDQPHRFEISRERPGIRSALFHHTPDFFVVRRTDEAYALGFEEWHTASRLARLAAEDPDRYRYDGATWHDVYVEAHLRELGLGYALRPTESLDPKLVRNTDLLAEHREHPVEPHVRDEARAAVTAAPGCTLAELLAHLDLRIDDALALIAQGALWCDLRAALLTDHASVRLYPDAQVAELVAGSPLPIERGAIEYTPGAKLRWAGVEYEIAQLSDTTVWLIGGGDPKKLPRATFEAWVAEGDICGISDGRAAIAALIGGASERDLSLAQARLERVSGFIESGRRPIGRTQRRWVDGAINAKHLLGHALPGLLDRHACKGNRVPRLEEAAETLAETVIGEFILQPEQRAASVAYGLYRFKAKQAGISPMGRTAFYRRVKRRGAASVARAQWGKKAANAEALPRPGLFSNTGDRVFARVHIDHTEFDVALIDAQGAQELGRAWCTLARDAYSGRILGFVLLYDAPSARSLQLVLREMVRKWQRLPSTIIFDHGSDAASSYFETVCAVYGVNLERRPAGNARYGAPVEAMFAKINRDLLWNLKGNTKIRKNVRKMSPDADPGANGVWTLGELHAELARYVAWNDEQPNERLGGSPRALHERSLAEAGSRPRAAISYDTAFRALTAFPGPRLGGRARVDRTGITVNGLTYWSTELGKPGMVGSTLDVRYEPLDARTAYFKIGSTWHIARCELREFEGRTEAEVAAASQELRRKLKHKPAQHEIAQYLVGMQLREDGLAAAKAERTRALRRGDEQRALIAPLVCPPALPEPLGLPAPSGLDLEEGAPMGFDKPSREEIAQMVEADA